jgi:hypothetical protein
MVEEGKRCFGIGDRERRIASFGTMRFLRLLSCGTKNCAVYSKETGREGWKPHMGNASEPVEPISVFYSYDPEDEALRVELEKHLRLLENQGVISGWHQRNIRAGSDWQDEADRRLIEAQVILLLISADFLASPYCYGVELKRALERHKAGEARVIPILLHPVSYENAPFSMLQELPGDGRPITKWENRDDAWVQVLPGDGRPITKWENRDDAWVQELRRVFANLARTQQTATHSKPIWNVLYRRNPFFTGRETILAQLHDWFTREDAGNTIALSQPLAISGLGGIGKTQIALEYAYRYHQEYQTALWVTAANAEILSTNFLDIATILQLSERQSQEPTIILAAIKRSLAAKTR